VQPVLGKLRAVRHEPEVDLERATIGPDRHAVATAVNDLPAQRPGPELGEQFRVCSVDDEGNDPIFHVHVVAHHRWISPARPPNAMPALSSRESRFDYSWPGLSSTGRRRPARGTSYSSSSEASLTPRSLRCARTVNNRLRSSCDMPRCPATMGTTPAWAEGRFVWVLTMSTTLR